MQTEVPILVFLMETKLNIKEVELLKLEWGMSNGIIMECDSSSNSRKGGLCFF